MTDGEFEALLDRRASTRLRHERWCQEVNELGLSDSSYQAAQRDAAYRDLLEVQAQIDAELEAERTSETEGA